MSARLSQLANAVSKFTPRRAWNAARIYASYHRSRQRATPQITGMPIGLSIEPTTSCNLRCPECPSGLRSFSRPTGMLDAALFRNIIDQVAPTLSYLTFYFQGEPYLHPEFTEMVHYASRQKIFTATSTNAHFLSAENAEKTVRSGLDRLIISIDGTSQETYQQYRVGGSLAKVIDGTKNIIAAKKRLGSSTPHVVFQFLVVRPNEHQVEEVRKLGRTLGVDQVVLKTAQIYDYENGSSLIPENPRFSRYVKKGEKFEIRNSLDNHCWKMWNSSVITWDGKVVPCCFDKDASYVMGDLRMQTFREIWTGENYRKFRQTLLRSRAEIEMCRNCTEGTKVWA